VYHIDGAAEAAYLTASPDGQTILIVRMDASTDDLMLVETFR
jgi:hypothetical protein